MPLIVLSGAPRRLAAGRMNGAWFRHFSPEGDGVVKCFNYRGSDWLPAYVSN